MFSLRSHETMTGNRVWKSNIPIKSFRALGSTHNDFNINHEMIGFGITIELCYIMFPTVAILKYNT